MALLSQGTWSIGGWAPHGPGQTGFQGSLAGPLKGDVLVSRSALSFSPLPLLSALSRLCSLKGPSLLGDGHPMDLGRLDFQGSLAGPLKGDVLVSRSALSFSPLPLLSALSRLCSLKGPGLLEDGHPMDLGRLDFQGGLAAGQTGFQGGLAGPLKGDVLVSRSALSLSPLSLLSALSRLCSLKGPGLLGDGLPMDLGRLDFQGGLAGPLKGDALVSRSALSFSPLSLLSALSRLCSLKGPGLLGDGLPMDLGRLDFRVVWLVH